MSGIHSFAQRSVTTTFCGGGGKNDDGRVCPPTIYDRPSKVYYMLPQQRNNTNDYIGSSLSKRNYSMHDGAQQFCNGTTVRKTSLITSINESNLQSADHNFTCTELVVGSKDIFQTVTLESLKENEHICPEYQYMVGYHRQSFSYRYGVIERIYCAEIVD